MSGIDHTPPHTHIRTKIELEYFGFDVVSLNFPDMNEKKEAIQKMNEYVKETMSKEEKGKKNDKGLKGKMNKIRFRLKMNE